MQRAEREVSPDKRDTGASGRSRLYVVDWVNADLRRIDVEARDEPVWTFEGIGPRRTPSLRGTVAHTEPFHWDGDMRDMADLVAHVFVERMSGPKLTAPYTQSLESWVFRIPAPTPPVAPSEASVRGAALFASRGCSGCHAGTMLTNNHTVDVGTGKALQVPSLVGVGWRAPFIHDGCAVTLLDRFTPACGGTSHGVGGLTDPEKADLASYLDTL